MSEYSLQALEVLRQPQKTFLWYIVPLLLVVIYAYAKEVQKRDWNVFFAGLALWGMDLFNEIWNSLVFHFTQKAPVWGAPGKSALLILIGYNIEISFMFALMGLAAASMLPKDASRKILGIPNRLFFALVNTFFCVVVECVLNAFGVLTWEYSWWSIGAPWLIFLIGYFPFFAVAFWVHDLNGISKKLAAVGGILGFDAVCLVVFGLLGWL